MNQDNKILTSLLKRLQELDQENKELKEKINSKQNSNNSSFSQKKSYLKIKELIVANSEEQQICTLCNCELNEQSAINLLKIYFCNNDCSLLAEKTIDSVINVLRKRTKS